MKITFELAPNVEAQLRASLARKDAHTAQRLLAEAIAPTIEGLLLENTAELSDLEFEAVADQLAEELSSVLGPNAPLLSDYAISRESIYR